MERTVCDRGVGGVEFGSVRVIDGAGARITECGLRVLYRKHDGVARVEHAVGRLFEVELDRAKPRLAIATTDADEVLDTLLDEDVVDAREAGLAVRVRGCIAVARDQRWCGARAAVERDRRVVGVRAAGRDRRNAVARRDPAEPDVGRVGPVERGTRTERVARRVGAGCRSTGAEGGWFASGDRNRGGALVLRVESRRCDKQRGCAICDVYSEK